MTKRFLFAFSILGILLTSHISAEEPAQKFVLENGMTIIVKRMPSSPTVSLRALVKNGSATEGPYLGMGVSHFIEHMLFKGTLRRPVGQIAKEIQSLGGEINASTSLDYTVFKVDLPSEALTEGIDVLGDMLANAVFDPSEVEKEREVVVARCDSTATGPSGA